MPSARFQIGATPGVAPCGVWQKTQTWLSVVLLTGPAPETERLCFVLRTSEMPAARSAKAVAARSEAAAARPRRTLRG